MHHRLSALCNVLALTVAAAAQQPASPLEAATTPKSDAPATIVDQSRIVGAMADAEIDGVVKLLAGSFASEGTGGDDAVALRYNAAPITVTGLDNAVYFEFTRADSPAEAFRQGVFHAYRLKGELRLRVFDFTGNAGLKDTMVGLWAAPDALPKLQTSSLVPNLDLTLTPGAKEGNYRGETPHAYPTMHDGAVEMTAKIVIGERELAFSDLGIAPDGSTAWGNATARVFARSATPPATVSRTDGGLIIVTIKAPDANSLRLVENGTVAVQYTGWLTDGVKFDSSRTAGRQAFSTRIPGGVIRGWNEGLAKIAPGERRRLVIPPEMAYGPRGFQRVIPPNSTLVFDIECVHVDNTLPAEASPGSAPASPSMPTNPHTGMKPAPTVPPR